MVSRMESQRGDLVTRKGPERERHTELLILRVLGPTVCGPLLLDDLNVNKARLSQLPLIAEH